MKRSHFRQIFNIDVKRKKSKIYPKMIMIWNHENMGHFGPFKCSDLFLVKVFLEFFFHLCSYYFNISYIESL
jgi:hypothetical protein